MDNTCSGDSRSRSNNPNLVGVKNRMNVLVYMFAKWYNNTYVSTECSEKKISVIPNTSA